MALGSAIHKRSSYATAQCEDSIVPDPLKRNSPQAVHSSGLRFRALQGGSSQPHSLPHVATTRGVLFRYL